jgi:hypothetical protein
VNFNHKDQAGFPMPRKEGHLLGDVFYLFLKAGTKYPLEHGVVINYTLDRVNTYVN